jgi:C-terminal processing protease CtpA/Prc
LPDGQKDGQADALRATNKLTAITVKRLTKPGRYSDGAGLWLSTSRFLTPKGDPLHEKGLEPTVAVDDPDIEFGAPAPTTDPILEKAIERLSDKKAA